MENTREEVLGQVRGPAIGIMAAGVVGGLMSLLSLALNAVGAGMEASSLGPWAESSWMAIMTSGVISIIWNLASLGVSAFLIYVGLQMLRLRQHGLCLAGSVVAMVPFFACCCIGLPFGIWGLVVLLRPETREHFD